MWLTLKSILAKYELVLWSVWLAICRQTGNFHRTPKTTPLLCWVEPPDEGSNHLPYRLINRVGPSGSPRSFVGAFPIPGPRVCFRGNRVFQPGEFGCMLDRVQDKAIQFVLILFDGLTSGGPPELVQHIGKRRSFRRASLETNR